jgi:diguanylate cyclase (GGDEF)-like protein/PAS domain S-box-containing protein
LAFVPKIPHNQKDKYEKLAKKDGFDNFFIFEKDKDKKIRVKKRDFYYPAFYLEPYFGNENALGFDVSSNSVRKEALTKAESSGQILATARIKFVHDNNGFSFLVFAPIYNGVVHKDNLIGFAISGLKVDDVLKGAITSSATNPIGLDTYLYDITNKKELLSYIPSRDNSESDNCFTYSSSFKKFGREYLFVTKPTKDFVSENLSLAHYFTLMNGFIFTSLISLIILQLRREKVKVERQNVSLEDKVKEATYDLSVQLDMVDKYIITSQTDLKGKIVSVSKAFCDISGYKKYELIGENHSIIRHEEMDSSIFKELWETIKSGKTWRGEIKNKKKNGGFYWVDSIISPHYDRDGKVDGYMAIRQDITSEKKIKELSITDSLTGLYNRRYFNEVFIKEIYRAKRKDKTIAFFMFDLDYFKQYNDTYGHQDGDYVLIEFAKVLRDVFKRSCDYSFRLGGEEFGAICYDIDTNAIETLSKMVKNTLFNLHIEHSKNQASPYVSVSIGVVLANGIDTKDDDELYKIADKELYSAKDSGRNRMSLCDMTNLKDIHP